MTGLMAALIGLVIILTALTFVWMLSLWLQDASVADIFWGLGFVMLAWLYGLLSPALTQRSWLVAALVTLWGTRLSAHASTAAYGCCPLANVSHRRAWPRCGRSGASAA